MLACVILNYNDADSVKSLVEKIKLYSIIDVIVVVDNESTDSSFLELEKIKSNKIFVIESGKNGGYGYGNNVGIKFAQQLGANFVLVCNPDVMFDEDAISDTLKKMKEIPNCVSAAPKEKKSYSAFKIASPFMDACFSSLLLNKVFAPREYPLSFFQGKHFVYVDALLGSLLIFDVEKFSRCGLYDERIFLYHEEVVVAQKFKENRFVQLLNLDKTFIHNHSITVKKNIKSALKMKKIVMDSHYFYLKNYCKASRFVLLFHFLLRPFCYLELYLWRKIRR